MRETFQRIEDNTTVYYEVEMDAGAFKKGNPWLFSTFVKFDGIDDSKEGYEEFLETKESLIIALEHEQNVKYVGSRIVDGWNEFYFYAQDSREMSSMVQAILSESNYVYESNVVKDNKWNLYERELFPTELEQHHIQSAKIVFLLEEEDDDVSIARTVEHYVSFTTPTQKNRFINTLSLDGFSYKDDIGSDEFEHGVALIKEHTVNLEEVNKIVSELYTFIQEEKGFYEGWSTTLINETYEEEEEDIEE